MLNVVFIPGLGADERLFNFIEIENCNRHFVKWIKPAADETLQSYVAKIKEQVSFSEPPVLIGVSLGGIIAMELREIIPVRKTIIIASIKSKTEMPVYFNWIEKARLNKMVPSILFKRVTPLIRPFINGPSDESTYKLFKEMLYDTDEAFLQWGVNKVLQWGRTSYGKTNLVHIHGTHDLVFPIRNIIDCTYKVRGGTHNLTMTKHVEISAILAKEIFL